MPTFIVADPDPFDPNSKVYYQGVFINKGSDEFQPDLFSLNPPLEELKRLFKTDIDINNPMMIVYRHLEDRYSKKHEYPEYQYLQEMKLPVCPGVDVKKLQSVMEHYLFFSTSKNHNVEITGWDPTKSKAPITISLVTDIECPEAKSVIVDYIISATVFRRKDPPYTTVS